MTNRQIIGHIFYGPFFLLFSTSPRYRYATLHSFVFHQITFPRSNEMKITMNCWSGWLSSDPALWEVGRKRWGAVAQPIEQQHELFYVGHLCFKMQDLIHVNATRRSCWRVEIQSTAISNNLSTCRSCPQWGICNPQWGIHNEDDCDGFASVGALALWWKSELLDFYFSTRAVTVTVTKTNWS